MKRKSELLLQVKYPVGIHGIHGICLFSSNCMQGFCTLLDRDTLLNEIMTSVEDLVSDTSQHVRAALGTQISGLAPILGKEE